jgi:hypothetical protein
MFVEFSAMSSSSLPENAALARHIPLASQLGDLDAIRMFCNESRLTDIRPGMMLVIANVIPGPLNSFGQVPFVIPDRKKLFIRFIFGIDDPDLDTERATYASHLNKLSSCECFAFLAFFDSNRLGMLGASIEPCAVLVANKPIPLALWDDRKDGDRFEYRCICPEIISAALDISGFLPMNS